jgi:PhzF family phenazine biosynthesis protein
VLAELLAVLGWAASDLDPSIPPVVAYAGAWHPVVAAATRARLAALDHDQPSLEHLADREGWTTVDLVWREGPTRFHARNPFPAGRIREDPATGAAAGALGGYLGLAALVDLPSRITVLQGHDMGRPGTLTVDVPTDPSRGVGVTGSAVRLPDA